MLQKLELARPLGVPVVPYVEAVAVVKGGGEVTTIAGMAKAKREYSRDFSSTRKKRVYFMLDKIPPALWIRVKAKAKREGVSLRALILRWLTDWIEQ